MENILYQNDLYLINLVSVASDDQLFYSQTFSLHVHKWKKNPKNLNFPEDLLVNPFQPNGIFDKATHNKVRMAHCMFPFMN